jgi:hypothetical protein
MPNYRKPTEKEATKLDAARKKTQEGIAGEKDIFSKAMPTMAKSARDDVKAGLKMRESVPASAREGEAYEQAGYKKGGKVMKKMKKYEGGGGVGDDVRARAMKSVEGLEGIKGSDIEDETGTVKGSIKRNEYGDLYDSEMKATPKAAPKAAAPTPKAEPKAEPKEKANPVQQAKDVVKGKDVSAPKSFTEAGGNTKARTQKVDASELGFKAPKLYDPLAKYEQTGPKRSEAAAPKPKAESKPIPTAKTNTEKTGFQEKMAKTLGMRSGGSVSSASRRADGCATKGKTKGRMV